MGLEFNSCFVIGASYPSESHGYEFASSMGHPRLDSVGLLVCDGMHIISGAPMLYYRSLMIASTLLGRG
jgi:hypothetical protein